MLYNGCDYVPMLGLKLIHVSANQKQGLTSPGKWNGFRPRIFSNLRSNSLKSNLFRYALFISCVGCNMSSKLFSSPSSKNVTFYPNLFHKQQFTNWNIRQSRYMKHADCTNQHIIIMRILLQSLVVDQMHSSSLKIGWDYINQIINKVINVP